MGADPAGQPLAPVCFGIGQVRGTEHGDERLRPANFAGRPVDDLQCSAGVVNEQPIAGDMVLAHHRRQPTAPAPVENAGAAIAMTLGMNRVAFLPEQRQGHAPAPQLAMDRRPVRPGLNETLGPPVG